MKMRIHQTLIGLSLLVLIPGALLGLLILMGAIGTGIEKGFSKTEAIAIPLLILPTFIGWWGVRLFSRLYGVFSRKLRKGLLWFHGLSLCYCGMWLLSPATRDGITFSIFSIQEQIMGLSLLVIPVLTTLFMSSDVEQDAPKTEQSGGGSISQPASDSQ